ncbi:MAG: 30S ribosomal protein S6 [Flavobacteriaceae bacterium TMED42]|nr:MAG: 30S ribosomal protein S6 [Flavobacteriaceae bacterium TMED42]|tara:strand:- start:3172 stop:3516 length:345 start_codon:yes stop_codon:yes gene_type:complete
MSHYETVFILNPVLSDIQIEEAVKKYVSLLESKKCKIVHKENWGLKKLAFTIQNKNSGFYHLLQFEGEGQVINDLEVEFRRDEKVMRFLTVTLDIHAQVWAEKRRKKIQSKVKA